MNYLTKGLEFVAAVGAAFGGFLFNIAPPDETGVKFAVGISSFLMLLIFLFIATLTPGEPKPENRKCWYFVAAVATVLFIASAFVYRYNFERLTLVYPPADEGQIRYVNGTELTPEGKAARDSKPNISRAELLDEFGENRRHAVWTQSSIDRANTTLVVNYVMVVLTITLALLCLIEGILQRTAPAEQGERVEQPNVQQVDAPKQPLVAQKQPVPEQNQPLPVHTAWDLKK